MTESFIRFAGLVAFINAGLTLANIVTIMLFFAVGGIFGRINDSISVFWALSFIPLLVVLYRLNTPTNATWSLMTLVAGIAAMIAFAVLQSLLVINQVRFEETLSAVLSMTGILGLSLIINGLLARSGQTIPAGLAWLSITLGLGFVFGGIGFWIGGQQHPLAAIGFIVTVVVGPIWAIWLGRFLLKGSLLAPAITGAGESL